MGQVLHHSATTTHAIRVAPFVATRMTNDRLGPEDRVLVSDRDQLYYLDIPYFFAQPNFQNIVNVGAGDRDVPKFERQIESLGISHILMAESDPGSGGLGYLVHGLLRAGCLRAIDRVDAIRRNSRTLDMGRKAVSYVLLERTPDRCTIGAHEKRR